MLRREPTNPRARPGIDVPAGRDGFTPESKPEAEARLLELVDALEIDLVVLARYVQVLSDELCGRLEGRAMNIHHSFLPSAGHHAAAEQADGGCRFPLADFVTETIGLKDVDNNVWVVGDGDGCVV